LGEEEVALSVDALIEKLKINSKIEMEVSNGN